MHVMHVVAYYSGNTLSLQLERGYHPPIARYVPHVGSPLFLSCHKPRRGLASLNDITAIEGTHVFIKIKLALVEVIGNLVVLAVW